MNFERFDYVVLTHDVDQHGLGAGHPGIIVELHGPDGLEVEFATAGGQTKVLLTLRPDDVRKAAEDDVVPANGFFARVRAVRLRAPNPRR
jgi:hypothetical protein